MRPRADTVWSFRFGDRNWQAICSIRPSSPIHSRSTLCEEGPLQVAHADGGGIAGLAPGPIVHVDGHEFVVDRRVPVPVGEPGGALERRDLVTHRQAPRAGRRWPQASVVGSMACPRSFVISSG